VREYGTGTVSQYQTKNGRRYRIQWHVPVDSHRPELGTRRVSKRGFASEQEALDALAVIRADQIRGISTAPSRDSFTAYATRWLDGHSCKPATRSYIRRVIEAMDPYIGRMRLSDIRPSDLASAYRGLEEGRFQKPSAKRRRDGLAPSTVKRYSGWVGTILNAAINDDIITKNPGLHPNAGRPTGPRARREKPFKVWTSAQVSAFCAWALANDEPWAVAWTLLARTGMRSGEMLALRWGDFDFEGKTLNIERSTHYDESRPEGERFYVGPVKGDVPRRIAIGDVVIDTMKAWRRQLLSENGARTMKMLRADDPVFPHLPGRAPTQPALRNAFKRVQRHFRQANPTFHLPEITVHDLRHTHASMLLHRRQSYKVVQERLGHKSPDVTLNTYAHLMPESQQLAVADLDEVLDGPEPAPTKSNVLQIKTEG
jgi:integrase